MLAQADASLLPQRRSCCGVSQGGCSIRDVVWAKMGFPAAEGRPDGAGPTPTSRPPQGPPTAPPCGSSSDCLLSLDCPPRESEGPCLARPARPLPAPSACCSGGRFPPSQPLGPEARGCRVGADKDLLAWPRLIRSRAGSGGSRRVGMSVGMRDRHPSRPCLPLPAAPAPPPSRHLDMDTQGGKLRQRLSRTLGSPC